MMSQEDPSDLIETVTAEIEAIIQEEINSQNVLDNSTGEKIENAPVNVVEDFSESEENVEVEQTDEQEPINTVTADVSEIPIKAEIEELASEILPEEHQEIFTENAVIEEVKTNASVQEGKEDFVEYTVNIDVDSPTQVKEKDIVAEVISVPLIETILNDAPIDENDGPRAKHLKQALRKALNNTVKSCSGDKLESCFPFNLKTNQFSQINATIINALKSVIDGVQEPFDEFLKSENLVDKLNKVDEFTRSRVPGTCETTSEAAITPQNLIDRKLYNTKLASLSKLEHFTLKLEQENSQLASELNNRQTEFADRLDRLKSSQQLLDAALDQISSISMNDLEVLVDKMNYQYQPSALKFHN